MNNKWVWVMGVAVLLLLTATAAAAQDVDVFLPVITSDTDQTLEDVQAALTIGVIRGCVKPGTGRLVGLIDEDGQCKDNETLIEWNAQGEQGPPGADGQDGAPGADGADGQNCWDLNGNAIGDLPDEDKNGDSIVDVADCQGPKGDAGDTGPAGPPGVPCAGCVDTASIADGAVDTAKLAANSVTQFAQAGTAPEFHLTGTTAQAIPGASISIQTTGGPVLWMARGMVRMNTPGTIAVVYMTGADVELGGGAAETRYPFTLFWIDPVLSPGTHNQTVAAQLFGQPGSAYVYVKNMIAIELKR